MFKVFVVVVFVVVSADKSSNIDELSTFAKVNQFPHQVAVLGDNGNEFKCTGTIVDEFTVLCAANCVDNKNRESREIVSILAGTNALSLGGVRRNVYIAFIEKDEKFLKDIAMLRLDRPLKFGDSIKSIEVTIINVTKGNEVVMVGWALKPSPSGELLGRLKYYKFESIGKDKCGQGKNSTILCLGDLEGENQVVNASLVCKVRNMKFGQFKN